MSLYACLVVCVCASVWVYVHIYISMYVCTYVYAYIHMYTPHPLLTIAVARHLRQLTTSATLQVQ